MFDQILIPLDGSDAAERALPTSLKIAETFGSNTLLVRAVEQSGPFAFEDEEIDRYQPQHTLRTRTERAEKYLAEMVVANQHPGVQLDSVAPIGDATSVIIDVALYEPAELIVMSSHGATGLQRLFYGSVTEKVLRNAPCPVLAVRSAEIPKHILLTLDGSLLAEAAIGPTIGLARAFGAKVLLTRIENPAEIPDHTEINFLNTLNPESGQKFSIGYDQIAWRYLEKVMKDHFAETGIEVTYDIERGNPAECIARVAKRHNCDLIAMSTHGRTGLRRLRYGSVTERMMRSLELAMLIVRPVATLTNRETDPTHEHN